MPTRYSLSKKFHQIGRSLGCFGLILQFFTFVHAQDIEAIIKISAEKSLSADVRTTFDPNKLAPTAPEIWFLDEYAGTIGLTKRLSKVDVFDKQGYLIARKQFGAADQVKAANIGGFRYTVDLSNIFRVSAAAHVSWLTKDGGLVMLDDVLPQINGKTAKFRLEVPVGWKVYHAEMEIEPNVYLVSNTEKSVFYIGTNYRSHQIKIGRSNISLLLSGEWHFSDAEAVNMVGTIYREYEERFGELSSAPSQIMLNKFPFPSAPGNWEADTRGRSVTIISSDTPFKTQSKQRLHEQLRHEMFHLWIPNGVNLSGNYDWFYEGFALYQSLRMGVETNTISFDNFLDTLGRAYAIDSTQTSRTGLIEASKNRFTGSNTTVYARGMIVAFMCDLALLDRSKGKRSVENILRDLYKKHHDSTVRVDGNEAVMAELGKYPELKEIVDRYIKAGDKIDIAAYARLAGIDSTNQNGITRFAVLPKPNSRQKDLLDKLGYNSWRRLSENNK